MKRLVSVLDAAVVTSFYWELIAKILAFKVKVFWF
jgi:hypothetical protein